MSNFIGSCQPILQAKKRFVEGYGIANDSTNPNKVLMISPGKITDSTANFIIENDDALYIDITKNGAGGLDAGSPANNTMYAIYVIGDQKLRKPIAAIASLASNSYPALPFDYSNFALIGYFSVNGSNNIRPCTWTVERCGVRTCYYSGASVSLVANSGTSGNTVAVPNLNYYLPPIETVITAEISVDGPATSGAGNGRSMSIATTTTPSLGTNIATTVICSNGASTANFLLCYVKIELNAGAPVLYYRTSNVPSSPVSGACFLEGYEFYI